MSAGTCDRADIVSQVTDIAVGSIKCDDGTTCPNGHTCCEIPDGSYACCPLPDAVCCSDGVHCCPNGLYNDFLTFCLLSIFD